LLMVVSIACVDVAEQRHKKEEQKNLKNLCTRHMID